MAQPKGMPDVPKEGRALLKLALHGQVTKCDHGKLNALMDHMAQAVNDIPPSPCQGGVLLVRQVSWYCIGGFWNLIEVNTWQCPDGSIVDVQNWIKATDEPCGQVAA